jgi:hypothetical protein
MCTEDKWMKSMLGLNILLENFLDTLERRLGFEVLSFKVQVHSTSKRELQCSKLLMEVQGMTA